MYNILGTSNIPEIAKHCKQNAKFENYIKSIIEKCFDGNKISSAAEREVFFMKVHACRIDPAVSGDAIKALNMFGSNVSDSDLNAFFQDCLMNLIGEFFKARRNLEKKLCENSHSSVSDQNNKILFYIAGYIIRALEKKYYRLHDKHLREKQIENIKGLINNSSEKTFTDKFTSMYEKKQRGGLKKPCDNFFLLVREFETVIRKGENVHELSQMESKEKVLESFMVGHYREKLFPSAAEEEEQETCTDQLIEDILHLFLTVRGHAKAKSIVNKVKKEQKNENRAKTSSSLRGTLKCISNK
ncbi:hypothetical protein DPMN_023763 [Dreissena polymorpha]|uniref:Uncharacterized protein n=1 Tax=Dreissena polymorpha TaxID=45954 RepID=A0A9D4LLB0_DREPO|nr:hypothetical protein DPMN_023763 [Dreissena polymorpha]